MAHKLVVMVAIFSAFLVTRVLNQHNRMHPQHSLKLYQLKSNTFSIDIYEEDQIPTVQVQRNHLSNSNPASTKVDFDDNINNRLLLQRSYDLPSDSNFETRASANEKQAKNVIPNQKLNLNNDNQTPYKNYQNSQSSRIYPHTPKALYIPKNPWIFNQKQNTNPKTSAQSYSIDSKQRLNAVNWRGIVDEDLEQISERMAAEYDYYEQKYGISRYEELPFCIVVPTFNNKPQKRYLHNIRSIVMQNYSNYHIVIIDDGSTDSTGDLILQYLQQQSFISQHNYELIRNQEQKKAMFNLRRAAVEYCRPSQIFLIVDGDDELLGRQVLKLFNAVFQNTGAWFVYSNFIFSLGTNIGYSRPFPKNVIEQNGYRNYPFITSHLRAYYTQLFINIRQEDLKDQNGNYFRAANDVAICIPTLQQCHKRVQYIPQLTYYYNMNTGQNNHVLRAFQQRSNDRKVRRKPAYAALSQLFENKNK